MKKFLLVTTIYSLAGVSLVSCSDAEQAAQEADAPGTETLPVVVEIPYDTSISIREIMASLIDPPADALWNSVRVVSDSTGITEYVPESDEDWAALRHDAISIIEGSNALMMPGRRVAPPGAEGEFPEYEFTPEEVEAILANDRASWIGFASQLQDSALEILDAVNNRDTERLTEWGAYLDEACEACHSVYWYRAGI